MALVQSMLVVKIKLAKVRLRAAKLSILMCHAKAGK